MSAILGIDVGGSTTKIVGVEDGEIKSPQFITAVDPVTSLFGAFGKYLYDNGIKLEDVEMVALTGAGSMSVEGDVYGCRTCRVDEFQANALGAGYKSGLDRFIAVSMGTGTSFVKMDGGKVEHIGGICIGGGTLQGLSRLLLKSHDIKQVAALAEAGDIANIDLSIGDICNRPLPGLPLTATASNFGKAEANASEADIAAGIVQMVLQTIGSAAYLAGLGCGIKDYVLIGNLAHLPQCKRVFEGMEKVYGVRFAIPAYAEFRTALGAALAQIL